MRAAIAGSRARGSSAGSISTRASGPWWRTRSWRKPSARSRSSPSSTCDEPLARHLGAVGQPRREARRGRQVGRRKARGARERADLRLREPDVEEGREHGALGCGAVPGPEVAAVVRVHAVGDGVEAELARAGARARRRARSCSGSSGPAGSRGSRRSPSRGCRRSGARARSSATTSSATRAVARRVGGRHRRHRERTGAERAVRRERQVARVDAAGEGHEDAPGAPAARPSSSASFRWSFRGDGGHEAKVPLHSGDRRGGRDGKLRVGIVFGGRSVEHEVSVASATLDPRGARPEPLRSVASSASTRRGVGGSARRARFPSRPARGEEVSLPAVPGDGTLVVRPGAGRPVGAPRRDPADHPRHRRRGRLHPGLPRARRRAVRRERRARLGAPDGQGRREAAARAPRASRSCRGSLARAQDIAAGAEAAADARASASSASRPS